MDYQITCVCGHRFLVSQDKVKETVICPACQQRLSPVVENAAPEIQASLPASPAVSAPAAVPPTNDGTDSVAAPAEETKRCPFCGEVILAIARKCKHCGEFLDRAAPPVAPQTNPLMAGTAGPHPPDTHPAAPDVPAVFTLSVSQWDNFWKWIILATIVLAVSFLMILISPLRTYALVIIPAALVFAGFIGWYFYLTTKNTRYIVRPLRIETERGLLSKDIDTLELFRIVDMELKQGLVERLLGIGTIQLKTTDDGEPDLVMRQIPHVRQVHKYLQAQVPIAAKQRGAIYMEK
jgi:membrane protein YdbS with pleckstrin-like domain